MPWPEEKRQRDKQRYTEHYTENLRLGNMNSTKTRERVSSHGLYIDMKYIATDKIKYRCTLQIPSKISKNISIVT